MAGDDGHAPAPTAPDLSILVDGEASGGRLALLTLTVARGEEPPRHRHYWEDETLFVLAGALRVWLVGSSVDVPAGAAIFLPRGVEHGFMVTSMTARLLVTLTPAGFEGCYRELHGVVPLGLDRLVATAARYGCEITGPPISAPFNPAPPSA
jgi:quercetin dioxygenase-like cupin family protein